MTGSFLVLSSSHQERGISGVESLEIVYVACQARPFRTTFEIFHARQHDVQQRPSITFELILYCSFFLRNLFVLVLI